MDGGKRFDSAQFAINDYKVITVFEKALEAAVPLIHEGLQKASALLKSRNDIIITLSSTNEKLVQEEMDSVNGYTPNSHSIFLMINPEAK